MLVDIFGDMDSGEAFFIGAIIIFIWLVIVFNIIRSATRSNAIKDNLNIQTDLLKEIARKQGVDEETINSIEKKYRPVV